MHTHHVHHTHHSNNTNHTHYTHQRFNAFTFIALKLNTYSKHFNTLKLYFSSYF